MKHFCISLLIGIRQLLLKENVNKKAKIKARDSNPAPEILYLEVLKSYRAY